MGLWLLGAVFWGLLLYPAFCPPRESGSRYSCRTNLRQLGMALAMYAQDYEDRLPPVTGWQAGLYPYYKNPHFEVCPSRSDVTPGYAYNSLLDRRLIENSIQEDKTPALFDSSLGQKDAADRLESFAKPHGSPDARKGNVLFLDGHVEAMLMAPSASAGFAPVWRDQAGTGGKR